MGTIGVRCSGNPTNLWFHLGVPFADGSPDPSFRTDGADKEFNVMLGKRRHPWERLTFVGSRIAIRVLAIPGVVELRARRDYFDLVVASEESWRTVLPAVVEIIRHETDDPQARVVNEINLVTPVPQWHVPLLRELFGEPI